MENITNHKTNDLFSFKKVSQLGNSGTCLPSTLNPRTRPTPSIVVSFGSLLYDTRNASQNMQLNKNFLTGKIFA